MSKDWKCIKCGECCHVFNKPVKNVKEVKKAHKAEVGFEIKHCKASLTLSGVCEHFDKDTHICKIYKKRPKLCKDYFCKRHVAFDVPKMQLYKKRCRACNNIRTFQKGMPRDKQSVCGNCWEW